MTERQPDRTAGDRAHCWGRRRFLRTAGAFSAAVVGLGGAAGGAAEVDGQAPSARNSIAAVDSRSSRSTYTIRDGTPEETTVYVTEAESDGPTTLVVGGVHGNEKNGWKAAGDVANWNIDAGTLVVLPEANRPAIEADTRSGNDGDLNRHFPAGGEPSSPLARAIWDVVRRHDPDYVWDLHSSVGIYSEGTGVGQAAFPTRAGNAVDTADRVKSYLNANYVPDAHPAHAFTGAASPDGSRDMLKHKIGADLDTAAIIFETYRGIPLETQVQYTKAAVRRFLEDCGQIANEPPTITIAGRGETATYEFAVSGSAAKSTAYDGTIDGSDTVDGGTVTGRTTHDPRSFSFVGGITDFNVDAPVDVYMNGIEVDPDTLGGDTLTIVGGGSTVEYEFTVDGHVTKSCDYGATINSFDVIEGSTVTGRTTREPDSFAYTGSITDFRADGALDVFVNGEPVEL